MTFDKQYILYKYVYEIDDIYIYFFSFVFLCSYEHFSIFFVQYLGVTAGIEPAT
jgi:hypothetical protein